MQSSPQPWHVACTPFVAMLIITRRKGQRIVLGHDIEIVISDISRSGVKIGVVAPNSLTILRGEVRDAVVQANREALASNFVEPTAASAAQPAAASEQSAMSGPGVEQSALSGR